MMLRSYVHLARTWTNHIVPSYWTYNKNSQRLRHIDNWEIRNALFDSFTEASRYRTWDGWSLHPDTCYWLADLLVSERIHRVIEFGAGFSTIFLNRFIDDLKLNVRMDSFEHQSTFNSRLQQYLADSTSTLLHFCKLSQLSNYDFQRIFESPEDAYSIFADSATVVPPEKYNETRMKNVFYEFDFSQLAPKSIDLLILDGPNGNGRSLAYPLLKEKLANPCWIVIDDYLDYPFIDDLRRIFTVEILYQKEVKQNEYAIAKVPATSSEWPLLSESDAE